VCVSNNVTDTTRSFFQKLPNVGAVAVILVEGEKKDWKKFDKLMNRGRGVDISGIFGFPSILSWKI